MSALNISDPVFTLRRAGGIEKGGLFDILEAALAGDLTDLPAMRAHQRAAVVTVLAVIAHTLRRYGSGSLAEEWDRQIGVDALRLTAPHDEPAFLQPPTDKPTKRQSLESLDCLLPRVQHEVKATFSGHIETWLFALMGGQARPSVNYNRPSSRSGLTAVLPSVDGTIGSEIRSLIEAYDRTAGGEAESAADHMLWLLRLDRKSTSLLVTDRPRPLLDTGRPVRLHLAGDRLEAWLCPTNVFRIRDGTQWMDDPHTPKLVTAGTVERFRLAAKPWDYTVQHQILFGGTRGQGEVQPPAILHTVEYRFVRLCGLGTDQGKTRGYHEALYAASRDGRIFSLAAPGPDTRAADLSARTLKAIKTGAGHLSAALLRVLDLDGFKILQHRPMEKATVAHAQQRLRSRAGSASVQLVLGLLSDTPDLEKEQQHINHLVAPLVRDVFTEVQSAFPDPLRVAAGEEYLQRTLSASFGSEAMQARQEIPPLARLSHAALHEIVVHLTPQDRATLRTMSLGEPPLAFWTHLAAVPLEQSELPAAIEVWKVILHTLGTVRHAGRPVGAVLAETEFSQERMSRLLTATGAALTGAIDEAGRWLISHDIENANLSALLTLGLGDALSEATTTDWSRRRLALDYVRTARHREAATHKDTE